MNYLQAPRLFLVPILCAGLTQAQGTLISVDFQSDSTGVDFAGNETVAPTFEPCFDGASVWNHISVPQANDPPFTGGSFPLVDSAGAATPATLVLNGDLNGFHEVIGAVDDLRNDYLIFNTFSNPVSVLDWSVIGVSPDTAYELVIYGHSFFDRPFVVTVDTDGDGDLADETPITTSPQTTELPPIRSSATGGILARCEGIGPPGFTNEASWAGFQLVAASDTRLLDDYSTLDNFNDGKYTFIDLFGGGATLTGFVGPDLDLTPGSGEAMSVLWNDGEQLSEVGDRVSIDVEITGDGLGSGFLAPGMGAGLYLSANLGIDAFHWFMLYNDGGTWYFLERFSPSVLSGPPTGTSTITVEVLQVLGAGVFQLRSTLEGPGFDTVEVVDLYGSNDPNSTAWYFGPSADNCNLGDSSLDNLTYYRGGLEATYGEGNGTGINQNLQTTPPAILGEPWASTVFVTEPTAPFTGFLILLFHPNVQPTGPVISLGGPSTELLLGPGPVGNPCGVETYAGPFATACGNVVIPNDCALVGANWATQVAVGSPATGFTLTNASFGVVGTR